MRGKRKTHRLPCVGVRAAADSQHSAGEVAWSLGAKPNVSVSSGWMDGRSRIIRKFFFSFLFFFLIHRTLNALYHIGIPNFLRVFLQNKSTTIPNSHRARPVEYNCDKNQASLDDLSAFGFQPPLVPPVSTWSCGFYVEMQADPQ